MSQHLQTPQTVIGPGHVGSFLGAIAGMTEIVCPSGAARATVAELNGKTYAWQPNSGKLSVQNPALVCTRVPDTPWQHLHPDCLIIQNGLFDDPRVGAAFLAVDMCDQHIFSSSGCARLVIPPPATCWQPVIKAWITAGIEVIISDDPTAARWEKAILNATVGPLCLITNKTMAAVWDDTALRQQCLAATAEGLAIADAAGISCRADLVACAHAFFASAGHHKPSLLTDVRELDAVFMPMLQQARQHGLSCPELENIYQQACATSSYQQGIAAVVNSVAAVSTAERL